MRSNALTADCCATNLGRRSWHRRAAGQFAACAANLSAYRSPTMSTGRWSVDVVLWIARALFVLVGALMDG